MLPSKFVVVIVVLAVGLSVAEDQIKAKESKSDRSDLKKSLYKGCASSYSLTCLKLDVVSWVDKLNENDEISVVPGLSVVKEKNSDNSANTGDVVAELAREFPNDPDARVDAYLMKKISNYLDSHSLKLNFWNAANAVEEGRGKGGGGGGGGKKGGGGLIYLLAAAAWMKATLAAIAMGAIALAAKKALFVAAISLLISAIIGLKHLTHHGHHSTTYEVVPKPIYSHANTHSVSHEDGGHYGHSSYGRSFDVPLPLGLQQNYKPEP